MFNCQINLPLRNNLLLPNNGFKEEFQSFRHIETVVTRKYPLRGYILGVLTHTTAWDRHWGGDETLKLVLVYID